MFLLDEATDPPIGVPPRAGGRPEARVTYVPGATLVLYTDGLVERRGRPGERPATRPSS